MTVSQDKKQLLKYKPIETKEELHKSLQYAVIVEFSTIPPYLTALYSLQDKTSSAYQTIRSVVIEEMLHLNLVCNMINAIGYKPNLIYPNPDNPKQPITYPTYIPHHAAHGPFIVLMAASTALMQNTFMAIEQPAAPETPPEENDFETIGQLYAAIQIGFRNCVKKYGDGPDGLFANDTGYQHTKYYFGSSGGRAIKIKDLATALRACNEIVKQGEGAPLTFTSVGNETERFGNYEHYGDRPDGTYGPILGTPKEMSHYLKFKDIAEGKIPLGDVYPMMPNPNIESFTQEHTKQLAHIFDGCYSILLKTLEICFGDNIKPDPFFTIVVPLMQTIFPTVATRLMQLPVIPHGDAELGPNAGPCFKYRPDTTFENVLQRVNELKTNLDKEVQNTSDQAKEESLIAFQQDIDSIQQALNDISSQIEATSLKTLL